MTESANKLTRIGVFYDGHFFFIVSNYYAYSHKRRSRISISGLHNFIRNEIAVRENVEPQYSQIVDAHYFRGRFSARDAEARAILYKERLFEDVLLHEGVITHFLPLTPKGEKGIDVSMALEVFELAVYKRFNVAVLITCDSDFVPLVRKLNTLGTRVMVLGWDFKFGEHETRTSQSLLNEVTYPILMSTVIDDRARQKDALIDNLFMQRKEFLVSPDLSGSIIGRQKEKTTDRGVICNLCGGYGFIKPDKAGENVFFYHTDVLNKDFNELEKGDAVEFLLGSNEQGFCARQIIVIDKNGTK